MAKQKTAKIALKCMECGKTFKRSLKNAYSVRCPNCRGVDIEPDYFPT